MRKPALTATDVKRQAGPTDIASDSPDHSAALRVLERRIAALENLTTSQSRELRIQFERIAQLQADWDILRLRLTKPQQASGE